MQLAPVTTPAAPNLALTLTWDAGNHLFDDKYSLVVTRATRGAALPFADAVVAARALVKAAEKDIPTFGRLAPVHALLAVEGGFVPATLATAKGFELPIDGEIANGRGGAVLRGLTVDRTTTGATLAALVGATSLVDLRTAATTSTWWRTADLGKEPGPWTQR